MLILKPWSPQLSISEIDLHSTPVWIQIHSLPMFKMTERCIKNIGQLVGPVLGPDFLVHAKIHVSHFFRVQVLLDPHKPLVPGYYQKRLEAKPCWVQLKYKKISDFCYTYGCIGHTRSSCEIKFCSSYLNFRFSPKMKAEGPGSEFRKWSIEASSESLVGKGFNMETSGSPSSWNTPPSGFQQEVTLHPRRKLFFPSHYSPSDGLFSGLFAEKTAIQLGDRALQPCHGQNTSFRATPPALTSQVSPTYPP